ncbi:MAG: DUF4130 domain-containing protein, partial [Pseudomonas sp.]|nr:DUF4130 domain-containing protein [Pseudomonas sp.]
HRKPEQLPLEAVAKNISQHLDYRRQCPEQWRQWARNAEDPGAELWLAYYRHTFNPARLNPGALRQHLPGRFWRHLPEGPLIPELVGQARHGKQRDGQALEVGRQRGKRIASGNHKPNE